MILPEFYKRYLPDYEAKLEEKLEAARAIIEESPLTKSFIFAMFHEEYFPEALKNYTDSIRDNPELLTIHE